MNAKNYTPVLCSCLCCKKSITTSSLSQHHHSKTQVLYPKPASFITNCTQCNCVIKGYYKKQFCSNSCAATHNNNKRDYKIFKPGPAKGTKLIRKSNLPPNRKFLGPYTKISMCVVCNKWFPGNRKTCSDVCCHNLLSKIARNKTTHPCNRGSIDYNGIKLGSSYELKVAISLDENNILWIKPKPLKYLDPNGKFRQYFPDFFLPDYNVYLDPKNDFLINSINPYHGFKDTDKILWVEEYNKIKVLVLNKNQLEWAYIKLLL
jgi:predicted nucleic acid-binding Zn ribbon protein